MSSVSSSNSSDPGMVNYYKTALRELEADTEKETRRLKVNQESEIQRLDEQHQINLRKQETEAQKVIENNRAAASVQYDRDQERFKNASDQLREATYDARGKLGVSVPLELHKKEVQSVLDSADLRHSKDVKNNEAREDELFIRFGRIRLITRISSAKCRRIRQKS